MLVYYCQIVKEHYLYFNAISKYMVANAYFSNMNHLMLVLSQDKVKVYSAIVYSVAFKRDIKIVVAVFYKDGNEVNRKIYFSTHLDLSADKIFEYYCSRFQIEFLYWNMPNTLWVD